MYLHVFHECILQYKEQLWVLNKIIDLFRVSFAAELSTNLVYNSIFVIDYDYIFFSFVIFH